MQTLKDKSEQGLAEIEDAVVALLRRSAGGMTNVEVTHALGLESEYLGGQRNYLSLSILGRLIASSRVQVAKSPDGRRNLYFAK